MVTAYIGSPLTGCTEFSYRPFGNETAVKYYFVPFPRAVTGCGINEYRAINTGKKGGVYTGEK